MKNSFHYIDICYENFEKQIKADECVDIYNQYKIYKQSESKQSKNTKEEKYEIIMDNTINTQETYYVDTFLNEEISTTKLEELFGKPLEIVHEKCRYEYRLKFRDNKKAYIISLYDWINEENIFEEYNNIEWHIASETDNKNMIKIFKNTLKSLIEKNNKNMLEHDDDCC